MNKESAISNTARRERDRIGTPGLVEIRRDADGSYQLLRDGAPFFVKGAGGFGHLDRLIACGGNSLRTWGSDQTLPILPEVRRSGLALCAGLWMEPPRHGFNYGSPRDIAKQRDRILAEVHAIKDEPGLLLWGLGNELDLEACDARAWEAVESLTCSIKAADPLHPVITVISKPRLDTLAALTELCPSLDAIGVNSYADIGKVSDGLDAAGWAGPYFVTEWGSDGSWEVPCAPWGAQLEPNSTRKADQIRRRYASILADGRRCLGSYGFLWGNKQETTSTWFSLFDRDGAEYEGVQVLAELWTGRRASGAGSPRFTRFAVEGRETFARVGSNTSMMIEIELSRGDLDELEVEFRIVGESDDKRSGGDREALPESYKPSWRRVGGGRFEMAAPSKVGAYRVMVFLTNSDFQRAAANIPIWIE